MGSVLSMNTAGMPLIAFLIFATTIAFPLVKLTALFYLLVCISGGRIHWGSIYWCE